MQQKLAASTVCRLKEKKILSTSKTAQFKQIKG